MSRIRGSHVARVEKDLIEVLSNPLEHVVVCLKNSNPTVLSWVLKVTADSGSLQGREFYFELSFGADYPNQGPRLRALSYIPHQSVEADTGRVCLEMLDTAPSFTGSGAARRYTGWSAAFSALAVLQQLQDFFLDEYLTVGGSESETVRGAEVSRCLASLAAFEESVLPSLELVELEYRRVVHVIKPSQTSAVTVNSSVVSEGEKATPAKQEESQAAVMAADSQAVVTQVPVAKGVSVSKEEVWVTVGKGKSVAQRPGVPLSAGPAAKQVVSKSSGAGGAGQTAALSVSNKFSLLSEVPSAASLTPTSAPSSKVAKSAAKSSKAAPTSAAGGAAVVVAAKVSIPLSQLSTSAKRRLKRKEAAAAAVAAISAVTPAPRPSANTPTVQPAPVPSSSTSSSAVGGRAVSKSSRSPQQGTSIWTVLAESLPRNTVVEPWQQTQSEGLAGAGELNVPVSESACSNGGCFGRLSSHTIQYVMMYLEPASIARAMGTCKLLQAVCVENHLWCPLVQRYFPLCNARPGSFESSSASSSSAESTGRAMTWKEIFQMEANGVRYEELRCFYSKKSVEEDVLGVPLHYTINPRTGQVDYIYSTMDTLGYSSYVGGLRKTVWGEDFNGFLPLYFTEAHFQRAIPALQQCIRKLAIVMSAPASSRRVPGKPYFAPSVSESSPFTPLMVLDVLPRLMNTMVVLLVDQGVEEMDQALHGYCQLHRLFVALVREYPKLRREIHRRLSEFVHNAESRDKSHCANLGELVPLLTVCEEVGWLDVVGPLMQESFSRSVMWLSRDLPKFAGLATSVSVVGGGADGRRSSKSKLTVDDFDDELLAEVFTANKVSQHLYSFHCSFLRLVAHPRGANLASIASKYDKTLGMPARHMKARLASMLQKASECESWGQYFQSVCLAEVGSEKLKSMWVQSMRSSLSRGYHSLNTDFSKIQSRGVSKILLRGKSFPRVVLCIDTSGSMMSRFQDEETGRELSRLDYVKEELQAIFRDKLTHRDQFTLVQFDHRAQAWSQGLQQATEANLRAASVYVDGWQPTGGTDILGALQMSLSVPGVQAVHLLSDGEVYDSGGQILRLVRSWPGVQIHTTAFFAPASGQALLQSIAEAGNGTYLKFGTDSMEVEW